MARIIGQMILLLGGALTMGAMPVVGQTNDPKPASSCTRDSAGELVRQQIQESKLIEDPAKRIAVMLRGADLLWPYREDRARAAFAEAFDLATQNYREKGDNPGFDGRLLVEVPDQRYKVITAISKRDPVWARKLSTELLQEEAKQSEESAAKSPEKDARTAEKLLIAAVQLLGSDQNAALGFARQSLRYPATMDLTYFIYRLAEGNRPAADQFYQEALTAYADVPMDRFLYLSAYPFGEPRDVGETPGYMFYPVPAGFAANPTLQRIFVQALLRRAQQMIEDPTEANAGGRYSNADQVWMALTRLGPRIEQSLPDLAAPVQQMRGTIYAILSQKEQQKVSSTVADPPKKTFDELIEEADRLANPARRESGLALAILRFGKDESLDKVVSAAEKLDDSQLRDKLLNWIYFDRTQQALKDKNLPEARRLAAKVIELDQRAYLYLRIADELIKQTKVDTEARGLLEEVLSAAAKAPDTEVKARALLGVAYLYTKVEATRSISVLNDAVKCINRIDAPDFSTDYVHRKIEGREFGSYATMQTPGFKPENSFKEIAKYDFDGALNLAAGFTNRPLRAMTTLALADWCLQNAPAPRKPGKNETKPPKPQN